MINQKILYRITKKRIKVFHFNQFSFIFLTVHNLWTRTILKKNIDAVNSSWLQDVIDIPKNHFPDLDLVIILVNDFLYGNLFLNTAWSSFLISNYISKINAAEYEFQRSAVHEKLGELHINPATSTEKLRTLKTETTFLRILCKRIL